MRGAKVWAWASVAAAIVAGVPVSASPQTSQPSTAAWVATPSRGWTGIHDKEVLVHGKPALVGRMPLRRPSSTAGARARTVLWSMQSGEGAGGGSSLPNLFDRLPSVQYDGGVDKVREGLNMLHVERERLVQNVMKKIRAASYDFGEQDWNRLFTDFDKDRNGWLDFPEFKSMCRAMGLKNHELSGEEMWIVFEELDYDRTGTVEVSDFTRWLSQTPSVYTSVNRASSLSQAWTYGGGDNFSLNMPVPEEIRVQADDVQYSSSSPSSSKVSLPSASSPPPQPLPSARSSAPPTPPLDIDGAMLSTLDQLVSEISVFVDAPASQLQNSAYYFLNELGLSKQKVVGLAIASPATFEQNIDTWVRPQVEYLREIGVPPTKVGKMIVAFPQLLEISLEKKETAVAYLESLGIPVHSVGKCISSHPQLLGLSVDSKLAPTVDFLTRECRIPVEKIGLLISSFPTVLAYGIETTLKPRLAYIRNELNVPQHRLGAIILKFPQLLGLAVETNLQPTVRYMVKEVGIPQNDISKIVQQHPQILGLSVEGNLKPKVSFLLDELGVPPERLSRIISSFPTLLSLSIEANLRPKLEYLTTEGGFSREDVLKAPHLLAYSLKQRIQPRIEYLRSTDSKMTLHSILSLSNQAFERRFLGYTTRTQPE